MNSQLLETLRTNYGAYALAMNPDWGLAYHQQRLLAPALEAVAQGCTAHRRLMNIEPFRHSKTEFGTLNFVPWYLGHNPTHNVAVLAYQKGLARTFGRAIRDQMQSPLYGAVFPRSILTKTSRAADEFETVSGGRFFAGGFDTGINGRGFMLCIIDDPHKNKEHVTSDIYIEKWRSIYNNVIRTRLEPGAAMVVNTTRWSPADLIGWRIAEDGAFDYFTGVPYSDSGVMPEEARAHVKSWRIIHLLAEATRDEGWRKPSCACGLKDAQDRLIGHGEPLWPERWPCNELQALKLADLSVWETAYQGRPTLDGGYWFTELQPHYYEKVRPEDMNVYMMCDPALNKNKKADYTCIVVVGTNSDRNIYLLDVVRDRLGPSERADAIFRLHRKWRPVSVGYEEYGLQADLVALRERMERENYRFNVQELGRKGEWHSMAKLDRIRTLVPLAANGRIWLPNPVSPHRLEADARVIKYFVDKEWNTYPGSTYDDMLDVFSRVNDPDMHISYPSAHTTTVSRPRVGGSGWMSA